MLLTYCDLWQRVLICIIYENNKHTKNKNKNYKISGKEIHVFTIQTLFYNFEYYIDQVGTTVVFICEHLLKRIHTNSEGKLS